MSIQDSTVQLQSPLVHKNAAGWLFSSVSFFRGAAVSSTGLLQLFVVNFINGCLLCVKLTIPPWLMSLYKSDDKHWAFWARNTDPAQLHATSRGKKDGQKLCPTNVWLLSTQAAGFSLFIVLTVVMYAQFLLLPKLLGSNYRSSVCLFLRHKYKFQIYMLRWSRLLYLSWTAIYSLKNWLILWTLFFFFTSS